MNAGDMSAPKFDCHKVIVRRGSGGTGIKNGSKVTFHFTTEVCGEPGRDVVDDSRNFTQPMELVLGKQFKLAVWENCLLTMKEGEVAQFTVRKEAVTAYPLIAKTLRDSFGKEACKSKKNGDSCGQHQHRCGMSYFTQNQTTGYADLDDLTDHPKDLKFTFEVVKIESENEYEKDGWIMTDKEKEASIDGLKERGNAAYKDGDVEEASRLYGEALSRLDSLAIKEKPGEERHSQLEGQKLPFFLNMAQCKLVREEYYPAIELCTMALQIDSENVKAYFRRGKAHIGAWNPREARDDLMKAEQLDLKLGPSVKQLLQQINELEKERNAEDRKKLGKLFAKA